MRLQLAGSDTSPDLHSDLGPEGDRDRVVNPYQHVLDVTRTSSAHGRLLQAVITGSPRQTDDTAGPFTCVCRDRRPSLQPSPSPRTYSPPCIPCRPSISVGARQTWSPGCCSVSPCFQHHRQSRRGPFRRDHCIARAHRRSGGRCAAGPGDHPHQRTGTPVEPAYPGGLLRFSRAFSTVRTYVPRHPNRTPLARFVIWE